jgi:hypothetical protein
MTGDNMSSEILFRFLHQLLETHFNKKGGLKMDIVYILLELLEAIRPFGWKGRE